jgi:hypothetical protein
MQASKQEDEKKLEIAVGKLAFAIVCSRARKCPNKLCGRRRLCQATFQAPQSLYGPAGTCPIMTEKEWVCVAWGMVRKREEFRAWVFRWDEAVLEAEGLSFKERVRRYNSPEEVAKRAEEARCPPKPLIWPYWQVLWDEYRDDWHILRLVNPARAYLHLLRRAAAHGCRCATTRAVECDNRPREANPDWSCLRCRETDARSLTS